MRVGLLYSLWRDLPARPVEYAMQVVAAELSRHLTRRGVEVSVYSQGRRLGLSRTDVDGVEHVTVPTGLDYLARPVLEARRRIARARGRDTAPAALSELYKLSYGYFAARDLRRRCDVAHVSIFDQLVPLIRSASPDTRIVLHMHDHKQVASAPEVVARRLAAADAVVGCSEFVTARVRSRHPELAGRLRTVRNAVDLERFSPPVERPDPRRKRVLFVGRLSPEKGVHVLLEAFAEVLRRHPDAELEVVGQSALPPFFEVDPTGSDPRLAGLRHFYGVPGRYAAALRAAIPAAAAERVRLRDAAPHGDVPSLLRAGDVFVFPAVWDEPFGLPVIEAMATGLPVVATRVGGIPETVEDSVTGFLVDPGDPAALADRIARLLDDAEARHRMGEAGRARAAAFSWERRIDEWLALYGELVASGIRG